MSLDDEEVDQLFDIFEHALQRLSRDCVVLPGPERTDDALRHGDFAGQFDRRDYCSVVSSVRKP